MNPEILENYAKAIKEEEKFNKCLKPENGYGTIEASKSEIRLEAGSFILNFKNSSGGHIKSDYIPNIINSFTRDEITEITNIIVGIIDKKFKDVLEYREGQYQEMLLEKIKRK